MHDHLWLPLVRGEQTLLVSDDGQIVDCGATSGPQRAVTVLGPFLHLNSVWVHVAELVLCAHFGPPLEGEFPIHTDRNLLNNKIGNLRWSFPDEEPELPDQQAILRSIVSSRLRARKRAAA